MNNHRFRIMFRAETPIQDRERVKLVIMALMRVFDHADIACKDSTRIFYGTPNCEFKECTTKVLPNTLVDQLVEMELAFRAEQQIETTQFDPRDYEPKTIEQITELLNDLRKYYTDLTHDPRMSVTWAIMSAGISAPDTIALMRQRWPDMDKTRKYETIVNGHKNNAITLGTIYHMIRQHEPEYGRHKEFEVDAPTKKSIKQLRKKLKEMY
jgi:hypothetical protein